MSQPDSSSPAAASPWHQWLVRWINPAAMLTWGIAVLALVIKIASSPDRKTNIDRYLRAGVRWLEAEPLYDYRVNKGFVYGPFSAVFYAVSSFLGKTLAALVWMLSSAFLLLTGLVALLRWGPYSHIGRRHWGIVALLVFPLALGNLDNAQANAFVIGLIMIAVAAVRAERWWLAAFALSVAIQWKVYPLAVGLLLVLWAPGKFTWRLAVAVVALALAPYLFQHAPYVTDQYKLWFDTRTADNRLEYDPSIAPVDLWFVLARVFHLPLDQTLYRIMQVAGGAAVAAFCLYGRWHRWSADRLLGGLFALVCTWMVLLGPASEIHTYLLLAPAAALGVVESWRDRPVRRVLALTAYGLLLTAILRVAFAPRFNPEILLALQPFAGIVFLVYACSRFLDNSAWPSGKPEAPEPLAQGH